MRKEGINMAFAVGAVGVAFCYIAWFSALENMRNERVIIVRRRTTVKAKRIVKRKSPSKPRSRSR